MTTDERARAAVRSLAEELSRLAHSEGLPADANEREIEECMDLAALMRLIPGLCSHHISGLVALVLALDEIQEHGVDDADERRVLTS